MKCSRESGIGAGSSVTKKLQTPDEADAVMRNLRDRKKRYENRDADN
jgi:hypothetical protein